MSSLICDLCGTPFSDSDNKCPICDCGRAVEAEDTPEERQYPTHEKVRGGWYSKKNVRKRRLQKTEQADHEMPMTAAAPPETEQDHPNEAGTVLAADTEAASGPAREPESRMPEPEPAAVEAPVTEQPLLIPAAQPEVLPEQAVCETENEKRQKILAVYRRDAALNLVLFFAVALLVVSLVYLAMNGGFSWLQSFVRPGQAVTATDPSTEPPTDALTEEVTDAPTEPPTQAPTDPPTEPPTDPPTEPPTDPPTEPPTEPPTQPPTEEPTKPLLDVKLTLNYYDLTFCAATHTTQLRADGIPLEDITWISDDPSVVTVSSTGLITAVGSGRTTVRAIYGDQEVTVKINCRF